MQKLNCPRCDVPMEFIKRENVQLGKTGIFSGDWSNIFAGALDVAIFTCPQCGKLELFRGELYEQTQENLASDHIAQTTCPTCGTRHDLDDPQCPRCRTKNPRL
ncbi:MAG: hypothetical protein E7450_03200 [Ruminococcaceae bacterium]|nr:hypothetical protein [Oscillospiraceae bacterium]